MHPRVLSKQGWSTVRQVVADGIVDSWTLAGGTALALQLGHRYSEDLDFFRTESFDVDDLLARLARVSDTHVLSRSGDILHVLLAGLRISFLKTEVAMLFPPSEYRGPHVGGFAGHCGDEGHCHRRSGKPQGLH